ncbi:MAG: MBL fold metallo-hydrolase [Candidatus Improbicoccus devescovinae]|nr:MAG: MBL fold metallo-hydrolase [Candidatus Improbicoccus devescovinae]
MKYKKHISTVGLFGLFTLIFLFFFHSNIDSNSTVIPDNSDKLLVHILDVGLGDCIVVQCFSSKIAHNLLIDAGIKDTSYNIMSYFKKNAITNFEFIFLTHFHSDHYGGISKIFQNFPYNRFITTYLAKEKLIRKKDIMLQLQTKKIEPEFIGPDDIKLGKNYMLGNCQISVLGPPDFFSGDDFNQTNNSSLVLQLIYKNTKFLFTGDASKKSEESMIMLYGNRLKSDFLKVGHHGSFTSSSQDFISKVSPIIAAVSTGKKHRRDVILDRLDKNKINVVSTFDSGNITLKSDGTILEIITPENYKPKYLYANLKFENLENAA